MLKEFDKKCRIFFYIGFARGGDSLYAKTRVDD